MKSYLKNYTSDVPVAQTIYRIEQVLIRCGVSGISKEFASDQSIKALRFSIPGPNGDIHIRMPVNVTDALNSLWMDYVGDDKVTSDGERIQWNNRKSKRRSDFKEQAERTAWKLMQDWVEVQLSLIQMKQVETLEVFLPYVIMSDGFSLYRRIQSSGFKALLPESTDSQP